MITLVIGGSASGKSEYAESIIVKSGAQAVYLATMQPFGSDGKERIARHLKLREGKGFTTVEKYTDIAQVELPPSSAVLLECVGNLLANELFSENTDKADLAKRLLGEILSLQEKCSELVIVSSDIFQDGCRYLPEMIEYIALLGQINKGIASSAHSVVEVVCGIPIHHKLAPTQK